MKSQANHFLDRLKKWRTRGKSTIFLPEPSNNALLPPPAVTSTRQEVTAFFGWGWLVSMRAPLKRQTVTKFSSSQGKTDCLCFQVSCTWLIWPARRDWKSLVQLATAWLKPSTSINHCPILETSSWLYRPRKIMFLSVTRSSPICSSRRSAEAPKRSCSSTCRRKRVARMRPSTRCASQPKWTRATSELPSRTITNCPWSRNIERENRCSVTSKTILLMIRILN